MVIQDDYLQTGAKIAFHDKDEAFVALSGSQRRLALGTHNTIIMNSYRVRRLINTFGVEFVVKKPFQVDRSQFRTYFQPTTVFSSQPPECVLDTDLDAQYLR